MSLGSTGSSAKKLAPGNPRPEYQCTNNWTNIELCGTIVNGKNIGSIIFTITHFYCTTQFNISPIISTPHIELTFNFYYLKWYNTQCTNNWTNIELRGALSIGLTAAVGLLF